jgi:probable rRNA maturation factor
MITDQNNTESEEPFLCSTVVSKTAGSWSQWDVEFEPLLNSLLVETLNHIPLPKELRDALYVREVEVSYLLTTDDEIQKLNNEFREKDKATNVLSFPDTELTLENLQQAALFEESLCLGDIALAENTVKMEAQAQSKQAIDHFTHLVIHGILHLLGYDHINDVQALEMESLEIKILSKLEIKNPYLTD